MLRIHYPVSMLLLMPGADRSICTPRARIGYSTESRKTLRYINDPARMASVVATTDVLQVRAEDRKLFRVHSDRHHADTRLGTGTHRAAKTGIREDHG